MRRPDPARLLNAPETSLAIWTDATSCVDVGDVVCIDLIKQSIVIVESKDGKVNNEILSLNLEDSSAVLSFIDRYGDKGRKQIERVMRQAKTADQAITIMNKDKGVDPVTGFNVTVTDHGVKEEFYDEEFNAILNTAINDGSACDRIGNSLWIYAFKCPSDASTHYRTFCETVITRSGDSTRLWLKQCMGDAEHLPAINLREGLSYPATLPLYLRNISVEHILSIVHRKLCVLLFFDWAGFSADIAALGGTFSWSTPKEGRRANAMPQLHRPLIIGDLIPQIHIGDAHINLGAPPFLHVIFGGLSPYSYAKMCTSPNGLDELKRNYLMHTKAK